MNIICIGCSYTAGMPSSYYSWPEKLAKIRPNDNVYNLAIGGASVLLCLYLLSQFKKSYEIDKLIFQITEPHRHSFVSPNFNLETEIVRKENYYRIDPNVRTRENIKTITPGNINFKFTKSARKVDFARQYYNNYSEELGLIQHALFKEHINTLTPNCFSWEEVPEDAKRYLIDEKHFDTKGHDIIAEWINNELERSIY